MLQSHMVSPSGPVMRALVETNLQVGQHHDPEPLGVIVRMRNVGETEVVVLVDVDVDSSERNAHQQKKLRFPTGFKPGPSSQETDSANEFQPSRPRKPAKKKDFVYY